MHDEASRRAGCRRSARPVRAHHFCLTASTLFVLWLAPLGLEIRESLVARSPLDSKVHPETTPETLISIKSARPPKSLLMRTGRQRSLCRTYENRPAALSNLYTSMQISACKHRGDSHKNNEGELR